MGAYKADNQLFVFAGGVFEDGKTSSTAAAGTIWVETEAGANHTDAIADGEYYRVCQKQTNGVVKRSPLLLWDDRIKVTGKVYSAASEQSSVFGSGGSTGSIEAINSNRYTIRVNFKNNVDMYSEQSDLHFFEYVSDANATQIEIADYFAQTMSKHEKFSGSRLGKKRASVKVERFTDAADAVISVNITTAKVTNGSKFITDFVFSSGSDISGMEAGNYLRIVEDGTVGDTPVATTDAIYKIVSVDNTNDIIELDQPFQGTTADLQDIAINQITAAVMASANVGIKITGLEQEWQLGLHQYDKITFDVSLDGWGDTTAVSTTAAAIGSGEGEQIAELEWFGNGSLGAPYRHGVPNNSNLVDAYAVSTDTYGVITIDSKLTDPNYAVAGSGVGRVQIILACKVGVLDEAGSAALQANTIFGVTGHSS
tara:strand:- start:22366 stop:23643 length:1278 start_codon:yes stop_codon:yes gene_type:complete